MLILSVKNEKINFFNRPIYVESSNEALSYIQNILMSDADRALLGLRNDLALYHLGEIDFVTGAIHTPRKPIKLFDLADVFSSIPEDKVPQTANQLRESIRALAREVESLKTNTCASVETSEAVESEVIS